MKTVEEFSLMLKACPDDKLHSSSEFVGPMFADFSESMYICPR